MYKPFLNMCRPILIALAVVGISLPVHAQSTLKNPSDFLGFELGSRFSRHHQVVDYVKHVAEASPNVEYMKYGETNEGRELLLAFISTPENLARKEEIRRDNLRLANLVEGDPAGEPLSIVWLSYNVHGNESVSSEAAMATLWELADQSNFRTQAWLKNTLVVLDPVINPDGRDRYVNWHNQAVGSWNNANPDAQEHAEPGPGGRTNHYNFDLNRDWAWLTQTESRYRIAEYNHWMPHIHVDFHEMGVDRPYFFAPAAKPFHHVVTDWQIEFQTMIGRNNATYFDAHGWLYFTKQSFDLFYPGYGDTYPTFSGAIGMTYEQGGGGRAGLGIRTAEGDTLTLADRIAHHHTTGLSTVEMGSLNRERILREFAAYFDRAVRNEGGEFATYVIKSNSDDGRTQALVEHLEKLGIKAGSVSEAIRTSGYAYRTRESSAFRVEPGDAVITAHQPRSTMLNVLFEPVSAISDSVTYDITAWGLPYAYDVEAYATSNRIDTDADFAYAESRFDGSTENAYAYLVRWQDVSDARFLSALLKKEIKVRYAEKAFELEGQSYEPGTLIITRRGNERVGSNLGAMMEALATRHHQTVTAVSTGFVDAGSDFGSGDVRYIDPPKVMVLRGNGNDWYSSGELWHYFERQIGYPVTVMTPGTFRSTDLNMYDVVVLPDASYSQLLDEQGLNRLKTWIRGGGRVVAVRGAATFLEGKDGFALKKKKKDEDKDEHASEGADTLKVYGERDRDRETDRNQGSIFRASVDNTHPLAFGFGKSSFVLRRGTPTLAYLDGDNVWNVGVLKKGSHVSGQVGYEVFDDLEESLAYGVQEMGRGAVVYLIDNPVFRGFWYSGQLLMANAVFFVGQ